MTINSEKEIIEFIKNNNLSDIIKIFNNGDIKAEQFNQFKNVLSHLIKEKYFF